MSRATDLAWCAGIMDGEGCISVNRSAPNSSKGEVSTKYSLRVVVSMIHLPTIERLKSILGGRILPQKSGSVEKRRMRAMWSATDPAGVLRQLIPYLVCKQAEARLGIEYAALPKPLRWAGSPAALQAERDRLYLALREAKRGDFALEIQAHVATGRRRRLEDPGGNCPGCGAPMPMYNSSLKLRKFCSRTCSGRAAWPLSVVARQRKEPC